METTWSMRLLAHDMLHLKCQHQQKTMFTVTAVTAKVNGSVGSVSFSLIFLMSSKKTDILGYTIAIQSKYVRWGKGKY